MKVENIRMQGSMKSHDQTWQIQQLRQDLFDSQFQLFCAQVTAKLGHMQDLSQALPQFLHEIKQNLPVMSHPELALVLCYPFTQECFIYHTCEQPLSAVDISQLRQHLLHLSSNLSHLESCAENYEAIDILSHQAQLLGVAQDVVIWRVYLEMTAEISADQAYLTLLDAAFKQGIQDWKLRQANMHAILQQERRDFSAELHDSIAQVLGFLRLKSAQLQQTCKHNSQYEALLEQAEELASYTHYAYQQTRELITATRLVYQELDFSAALKKVIHEFEHQSGISFELDNRVMQFHITAKQSVQLLYIIRESLSNIVRHSHATSAQIYLDYSLHKTLTIKISDDGRGIDVSRKRSDSFGLEIMRERAERIGAVLNIMPNTPQGTCVLLQLDIQPIQQD